MAIQRVYKPLLDELGPTYPQYLAEALMPLLMLASAVLCVLTIALQGGPLRYQLFRAG